MNEMIGAILTMESMSFYLILALSAIWSYLIAEMLGSTTVGILCMPLFSLCSFVMMYIMQSNHVYLTSNKIIDVFIGSSLGSIIGVAATIIAIRLISARSDARLKSTSYKNR